MGNPIKGQHDTAALEELSSRVSQMQGEKPSQLIKPISPLQEAKDVSTKTTS